MRNPFSKTSEPPESAGAPSRGARRPVSTRGALLLAVAMLALGVGVGAAIGPAPSASFAGVSPALLQRLPELLAAIAGSEHAGASATVRSSSAGSASASEAQAAAARRRRRRALRRAAAAGSSTTEAPSGSSTAGGESTTPSAATKPSPKSSKLPAVSSVWLIELDGESFSEAQAQPASAPFITGTLLHEGALMAGWNALQAGALASEAALLAPVSEGGSPPLVHQIVQPACPEGAAGATCASAAGKLAAADAFAKETLAQITGSSAYREHGLVVVTFATVGIASQQGLPAGASSATLTDKPPAGVLVLSPFAKAGSHASLRFNATSPSQSLQALLG